MDQQERRKQNIYWTIGGNYDRKYSGQDAPFAIGEKAIIDAFFPNNQLETLIEKNYKKQNNKEDLKTLLYIGAREWTKAVYFRERPGMAVREKTYYQDIHEHLGKLYHKDFSQSLEQNYAAHRLGKPIVANPITQDLLGELLSLSADTNVEFLQGYLSLMEKYFHVEGEIPEDETVTHVEEVLMEKETKARNDVKFPDMGKQFEDVPPETVEAAEFTNVERDITMKNDIEQGPAPSTMTSREKVLERVTMHYGRNELSLLQQNKLENTISTGIHQGMKLHVTKGNFGEDMYSRFYQGQIYAQRTITEALYEKDRHHYERAIFSLREILKKNMVDDSTSSDWKSTSGNLDTSLIWKNYVLGEEKIFQKKQWDDEDTFSVDILLDMSGSQEPRQEMVAIQGYLITEALVGLNIPTRVIGFSNLYNYQILRLFRDYYDPKSKNKDIFAYKAGGSNRDGYAFRYVYETMMDKEVENRIVIILSDGQPNDMINLTMDSSLSYIKDYINHEAIYDTAAEVLKFRLNRIAVLGVFTGEDSELAQEKKIYGKDFVRITELRLFHTVVGKYLKAIVDGL